MLLQLPDFSDPYCVSVGIFARILDTSHSAYAHVASIPEQIELLAAYESSAGTSVVRVVLGGGSEIDLEVRRSLGLLDDGEKEKATVALSQFEEVLAPVLGAPLSAIAMATFRVEVEQLPESGIIRNAMREVPIDEMKMRILGSRIQLTGGSVNGIEWRIAENYETAIVFLDARRTTELTDQLISSLHREMLETFNTYILGTRSNVG